MNPCPPYRLFEKYNISASALIVRPKIIEGSSERKRLRRH